jgi:hypothetical protein
MQLPASALNDIVSSSAGLVLHVLWKSRVTDWLARKLMPTEEKCSEKIVLHTRFKYSEVYCEAKLLMTASYITIITTNI